MRRFAAVLLLLAALPVATAAQAAGGRTSSTLQVSTFRVLFGHRVTLTGRATSHEAGLRVAVFAQAYRRSLTRAATVTTRSGGYWSYRAKPSIQTAYQARLGKAVSRTLTVGVQPSVSVKELANGRLSIEVKARRSFNGRAVQLQTLQPGGTWQAVARPVLGARSSALVAKSLPKAKVRVAMSVNQAGAGYLGTTSHPLIYRPLGLTLSTASFKVYFKRHVRLSGSLTSGQAGARVSIVAWPYGRSAPRRVATVKTGSGGRWSYTARPSVQTSYFARFGAFTSRRLTIGVKPLITVEELPNDRVTTHVIAAKKFSGRKVELQHLVGANTWRTVVTKRLNDRSNATFSVKLPASRLRVAISVNQAGVGFLGSTSKTLSFHGT